MVDRLSIDASNQASPPHPTSSTRPSSSAALTTFPNPFEDEPEPGLFPALFTKVKNSFVFPGAQPVFNAGASRVDKGSVAPSTIEVQRQASSSLTTQQTEAQAIVEAERRRNARRPPPTPISISISPSTHPNTAEDQITSQHSPSRSTVNSHSKSLKPPSHTGQSASSSLNSPSIAPSAVPARRLVTPAERQWRPSGAAPAQVTISPVTSVTTTVQATKSGLSISEEPFSSPPLSRPAPRAHAHAHFAPSPVTTRASSIHHPNPAVRLRRSSIATIPDSPSSISLSAMIAANAELSQNASYVPGFPLPADDSRSVRSFGLVRKSNSVSRLIRRMRGEGLSKHYWMADEHCKECYDCKSVRCLKVSKGIRN